MATNLQSVQPLPLGATGPFGDPSIAHLPPNMGLPPGSQPQIELLLLQILSQLRLQKDCSSTLDALQREKAHWDTMEEELEEKLFELRKEKRQLETSIADLQFENQQLKKGKCNITDSHAELSQMRINSLEKQVKQEKENIEKFKIEWDKERDEYEKKLSEAQTDVIEGQQKLLQTNFKVQELNNELETCKSNAACLKQGPTPHLKDAIKEFFSFLEENGLNKSTNLPPNDWKLQHVAAAYGDITVLDVLLEAGADLNALDASDTTPLMLAATRGNTAAVLYLIRNNATVTAKDKYGSTALHRAAYGGHADVIRILIANSHEQIDVPNSFNEHPLHLAAYYNRTEAVEAILKGGFDVDPLDSNSCTPLQRAAERGNLEIVKLLIQYKADTFAQSAEAKNALDYAEEGGHQSVVQFLTENVPFLKEISMNKVE